MSHSRHRTREFLVQSLYGRVYEKNTYNRDIFLHSFFETSHFYDTLDEEYLNKLESWIPEKQSTLLHIIELLAPKFDLETMPVIHLIILMIALYEMLFLDDATLTEKITMNEAVELAKKFSDEHGRKFVNGVLSEFSKKKMTLVLEGKSDFILFR